ncbi:MAG: hypothetical protein HY051_06170 [Candidatus Aenigmarchaeota archaeon]|nr:hypothetical protein [Candidatus Aenigmarchaeota archaeon]
MATHKMAAGAAMVVLGLVALSADYLRNYISVPLADMWVPALIIVIAGTLPALLIIFGSIIVWGELEEKKAEKEIIKIERKLVRKKRKY